MKKTYVRLTFQSAGARRSRTVWAEQPSADRYMFWVVNRAGDRPNPQELIVATEKECLIRPAVMSRKYGSLMTTDDPDLNNEIDGKASE